MKKRGHSQASKLRKKKVVPATRQSTAASVVSAVPRELPTHGHFPEFDEVFAMIEAARQRAYRAVNTELVGVYWQLGPLIGPTIGPPWPDSRGQRVLPWKEAAA
jgi:hypothetical protein